MELLNRSATKDELLAYEGTVEQNFLTKFEFQDLETNFQHVSEQTEQDFRKRSMEFI